jgi:hypothetical protein
MKIAIVVLSILVVILALGLMSASAVFGAFFPDDW